jgi:hypothetical protein
MTRGIMVGRCLQDVFFKDPATQTLDSRSFDYAFDSQSPQNEAYASQAVVYDTVGPGLLDSFRQVSY